MAIDEKLRRSDAEVNAAFPAKPGGPLVRRISPEALQRVINAEGPEVMGEGGKGFWRDMDKRFPHLQARASGERRVFNGVGDGRRGDANPRRLRLVHGIWMERVGSKWEEIRGQRSEVRDQKLLTSDR
jgi:hypothetical protein